VDHRADGSRSPERPRRCPTPDPSTASSRAQGGYPAIDTDGMRVTAFLTDTPPGVVAGQLTGLELRHRQHARVEDRIRELKAT
jgi:hypothetical protein